MLILSNGRIWVCYRGKGNQLYLGPRNPTDGTYTCSPLPPYSNSPITPTTLFPPALVAFSGQLVVAWCDISGFIYCQPVGEDCHPRSAPVPVNVGPNIPLGYYPALAAYNNTLYLGWLDLFGQDGADIPNHWIWYSKSSDCKSWATPLQQQVKGNGLLDNFARSPCAPCFCYDNGCVTLCWIQQVPDPIYKCVLSKEPSDRIPVGTTESKQLNWGLCWRLGVASNAGNRWFLLVTTLNGGGYSIYVLPSDSPVIAFTLTESGDSTSQWAVAGQIEAGSKKVRMVWAGMKPDPDPACVGFTYLEECDFDV